MSAWYNEIEPYAAQWLRNLVALGEIPDGVVDERSIVDVRADELAGYDECHFFAGIGVWARAVRDAESALGRRLERPLFTGSCPCQPLSAAGQRKGHVDERHLWPAFHNLIAQRRPSTIFGEQVASKDGREWMSAVRADLEASGYAVGTAILPAAGVGAHLRYRLFWVADAPGQGPQGGRHGGRPRQEWQGATAERSGEAGLVADADERLGGQGCPHDGRLAGSDAVAWPRLGSDGHTGPVADADEWAMLSPPDGFWRAADWLYCRDGKWRPVEPGTFPLVDGSAFKLGSGGPFEGRSRAGMLRGYGNAVVLPVATEFVQAAMEARGDLLR